MTLFPTVQPREAPASGAEGLYVEAAWDFERDAPIYRNGSPLLVSGAEAVLTWAWNALRTPRCRHEIFTWDYGAEFEGLIGKAYDEGLKRSEAARHVRECLMANPYITGVRDVSVSFGGGALEVSCAIDTVYGEARLGDVRA